MDRVLAIVAFAAALLRRLILLVTEVLADVLAPPACAACDAPVTPRAVFCAPCAAAVAPAAPTTHVAGLTRALPIVAFAAFGGPVAAALRRLKYAARPDLAAPLGHLARRAAHDAALTADLIVPVPLHPRRLADRGYNQAALLAAEIASELAAPLAARLLARARDTPQQARLDREGRVGNVAGAFHLRDPARVRGRHVVLVDDVATTGATLAACAAPLFEAGAASVTALVVARALEPGADA